MAGGLGTGFSSQLCHFVVLKHKPPCFPNWTCCCCVRWGVQSLTCHLRGTECPERSGLESPHDCSQRGCSLEGKEVAPRVSLAGARLPGGRICPLQLLSIGDFSHIYQLWAFLFVYLHTHSDTHVCAGADKCARPCEGRGQPHVVFLRSWLFRFCFQSGSLLGLGLDE